MSITAVHFRRHFKMTWAEIAEHPGFISPEAAKEAVIRTAEILGDPLTPEELEGD